MQLQYDKEEADVTIADLNEELNQKEGMLDQGAANVASAEATAEAERVR